MIVRMWHGGVPSGKAQAYRELLNRLAVPDYRAVEGNISVYILERQEGEMTHFITMTFSLAPAFAILLERLSPKEQLVLLPREVFDSEYEEIAEIIRKSAVTCRQIFRRARQHISSGHSRFVASPEQLEKLAGQFGRTCASGD